MAINIGRKVTAVITGLITSLGIIILGWMISTKAPFSSPAQMEYVTHGDLINYANAAPPLYWAIGLITYAVAGFAGGFITTKMSRRWTTGGYGLSMVTAAILTLVGIAAYAYWPGPLWFLIGTIFIFVATAALGHRLAEGPHHQHVPETA